MEPVQVPPHGLDWDVDFWYPLLEAGLTFETRFVPLARSG